MCHVVPKIERVSSTSIDAWKKCKSVQVLQPCFVAQMQSLGITNVSVIPNCVEQTSDDVVQKSK